jgi:hypothetical protein
LTTSSKKQTYQVQNLKRRGEWPKSLRRPT